jgi:hypothetical protein
MGIWQFCRGEARPTSYVIPHLESIYFNQQILGCLANVLSIFISGMFGMEMELKIIMQVKELGKMGFTSDRRTLHFIVYRFFHGA